MPAASRDLTRPSRGWRRKTTRWREGFMSSPVEPQDDARRQPGEIDREAAEVAQGARDMAVAPVARRRGDGVRGERPEAMTAEAPRQIDILHQRQRPEAADRAIKRRGDEQPLIAIRQRQPPAAPG